MTYPAPTKATHAVAKDIFAERARQDEKWGEQNHGDFSWNLRNRPFCYGVMDADRARGWCERAFKEGDPNWADILTEEVAEAFEHRPINMGDRTDALDQAGLREELVQVAAVVVAWIEAIDRRNP